MFYFRAATALLLIVGFYFLALALAWFLLYIPYHSWVYQGVFHGGATGLCVLGALMIVYAVIPRRDLFLPPGPRLTVEEHPRFHALVVEVAEEAGQPIPEELYLIPEVNAWVSRRGGTPLAGGRRVLGVGLPLLAALSVPQLKAVLAHEFGHERGGHVVLGGWIYGTRLAMLRAAADFSESTLGLVFHLPLVLYIKLFLFVTSAISRHQELEADRLAGKIAGPAAAGSALFGIRAAGIAYHRFVTSELIPLLGIGYRPPLREGFDLFVRHQKDLDTLEALEKAEEPFRKSDLNDTHPPLRQRLAALDFQAPGVQEAGQEGRSLGLIQNPERYEVDIIAQLTNHTVARRSKPASWQELGSEAGLDRIHGPAWTRLLQEFGSGLKGITPRDLPGLARDPEALGRKLTTQKMLKKGYAVLAHDVVGVSVLQALRKAGCSLHKDPGQALTAQKGDLAVQPLDVLSRLVDESAAAAWLRDCVVLGIDSIDLGTA